MKKVNEIKENEPKRERYVLEDIKSEIHSELQKFGTKFTGPVYTLWANLSEMAANRAIMDPPMITGEQSGRKKRESISAATSFAQAVKPASPKRTPIVAPTTTLSSNN